jgi:hypothetical protein
MDFFERPESVTTHFLHALIIFSANPDGKKSSPPQTLFENFSSRSA